MASPFANQNETPSSIENDVRDALYDLGWDFPFFGLAVARVISRLSFDKKIIDTACVTPRGHVFVNPEFAAKLGHGERAWVMAHELCHPMYGHESRRGGRDRELWNVATDMAINAILHDAFEGTWVKEPVWKDAKNRDAKICLPTEDRWQWSAERIYDALLQDQQDAGGKGGGPTRPGDENDDPDPNGPKFPGQPMPGAGCGMVDPDGDSEDEQSVGADGKTLQEVEQEFRELMIQSAAMQKQAGKERGAALCRLAEVPEPKVPWGQVIRKGCARALAAQGKSERTWRRRGMLSQIAGPYFLPGWTGTKARVACVIDTSGSMSDAALHQCVAEVEAAAEESGVPIYLVTHDHGVQWEGWLLPGRRRRDQIAASLTGRGGTDAHEAYARVESPRPPTCKHGGAEPCDCGRRPIKFDVFCHLTDCYLSWPTWPANTKKRIVARIESGETGTAPPDGCDVYDVDVEGTWGG